MELGFLKCTAITLSNRSKGPPEDLSTYRCGAGVSVCTTTGPRSDATGPRNDATGPRNDATGPRNSTTGPRNSTTGPRNGATGPRVGVLPRMSHALRCAKMKLPLL